MPNFIQWWQKCISTLKKHMYKHNNNRPTHRDGKGIKIVKNGRKMPALVQRDWVKNNKTCVLQYVAGLLYFEKK